MVVLTDRIRSDTKYPYVLGDEIYYMARALGDVQVVISDGHSGHRQARAADLIGLSSKRRRVQFMHNVPAVVPTGDAEVVAAAIREIFAQPDAEFVEQEFDSIAGMLCRQLPKVEATLREAKEIKRRTDFVGLLPNSEALPRPTGVILVEQHDE